ncbi:MAG: hypothetical protein ACRC8Y_18525 [Chroococcales cyanobacterium]
MIRHAPRVPFGIREWAIAGMPLWGKELLYFNGEEFTHRPTCCSSGIPRTRLLDRLSHPDRRSAKIQ